jgi:hypothetical protein
MRLSDIAWWMRLLCQNIAIRANHDDREVGNFWDHKRGQVHICTGRDWLAVRLRGTPHQRGTQHFEAILSLAGLLRGKVDDHKHKKSRVLRRLWV